MKKLILLTAICLLHAAAYAQRLDKTDERLDRQVLAFNLSGSDMSTVEMQKELRLNEEQFMLVAQMNHIRYQQLELAGASGSLNPVEHAEKMRNIHLENDKVLRQVLSQEQLRHFLELEGRQNVLFVTENDK